LGKGDLEQVDEINMTEQVNLAGKSSSKPRMILYLVLTAVLWSTGGFFIKAVDVSPLAIAGVRSLISALLILATIRKPKFSWSWPQIGAAFAYAATLLLFVVATKLTTSANAILIQYSAPIYAAFLGAWILKERLKPLDIITIFTVLFGIFLFFIDSISFDGFLGNLLAALSGFTFGSFAVLMRMQKEGSPIESVLLGNIIVAAFGLPFLSLQMPDAKGWLYMVIMGVLQLGLPYILYSKAIKHVTALEATLIPVLEPILNPVWVFILVGEAPGKWAIVGGVIVIAAVTGRCLLTMRE